MNLMAVCISEIFNSLNQSSFIGVLATSSFKIKIKGARMGYRLEVKCSSRRGKILYSILNREEKGEREGREEMKGDWERKNVLPLYIQNTYKKENKPALQIHCHLLYCVYSSVCLKVSLQIVFLNSNLALKGLLGIWSLTFMMSLVQNVSLSW